jgi:hypothetical protein
LGPPAWAAMSGALVVLGGVAEADPVDPPPDKSGYTFLDPVPDDQMRPFSTDRPTKSSSPYSVDAGHFQVEADFASWTYDRDSSSRRTTSTFVIGDPTLKLGLTANTDVELVLIPLNVGRAPNQASGIERTTVGFGDVYGRLKVNLFGNDGGDYALAIVPYVKAPTAGRGFGDGYWEGGAYAPFAATLADGWTLGITTELDILENARLDGTRSNYQATINFSHALLSEDLTGSVEVWGQVDGDRDTPNQYTLDLSLAWAVRDNLQIDGGVNIGLNKAASDAQAYFGISRRF